MTHLTQGTTKGLQKTEHGSSFSISWNFYGFSILTLTPIFAHLLGGDWLKQVSKWPTFVDTVSDEFPIKVSQCFTADS